MTSTAFATVPIAWAVGLHVGALPVGPAHDRTAGTELDLRVHVQLHRPDDPGAADERPVVLDGVPGRRTWLDRRVGRDTGHQVVASNRRARHDYTIVKTYEAGIVLAGTEVKSLRESRVSLVDAFAQEHEGEIMLYGLHIAEYGFGSWTNHQPRRTRKLLLRRVEIDRILERTREGGMTLVPLSLYFAGGWAKLELALARGRRSFDKRQAIAERDANREIARQLGRHLKRRPRRPD